MASVVERTRGAIGLRARRVEDDRLLRGEGRFVDDVEPAHLLHMAVGRCPFPRAQVLSVDVSQALELEGVEHVLVGSEVVSRTSPISVLRPVPGAPPLPNYAMASDVAVYEGQPVVSVVAVDRYVAEDAIELVWVDYDPLPHVPDVLAEEPVLHADLLPSNLLTSNPQGSGDPEARLAAADVVVGDRFWVNRVTALPMETRAVVAEWRGGLVVHHSTQVPHLIRVQLAETLGLDEGAIRVVVGDVGGGFGLKLGLYPEDVLACLHARDTRRPVKWVEDRNEHFRASTHARESVHDARIGGDADGAIVALTDTYATDLGALNSPFGSAQLTTIVFPGPYRVRDAQMERRVTITSKTPIGAYRGYGQPESNFVREVLVDRLARKLGRDPLELRLQNMLRPDELPWVNAAGAVYDSGDYAECLRLAADAVDYDTLERGLRDDGRRVGIGLTSFVERTGYASAKFLAARGSRFGAHESVTLRANRSGGIDLYTGVPAFGTGVETVFAQICAGALGIEPAAVSVHPGDTASAPVNTGAFASRTMIAAAGAIEQAAAEIKAKTLRIAAVLLDGELEIAGREVRSGDGASVPLARVFEIAIIGQGLPEGERPGLDATAHFEPPAAAYSYGSAAAVVAVDPSTGDFDVERFVMVHDCGVAVNPTLVEGQVLGALAQGFGAALMEEIVYDPDTGQLVNGSMMDYFAPTASDLPPVELRHTETPSPVTPFGVRGVGEVGTIPPAAAIANAICDALAPFGVELNRLPLTPERVWRALQEAR
jgi:aerobic carbon-monoxide dehydrogenase large subunit